MDSDVAIGRVSRIANPAAVNESMLRALIAVRSFGFHGVIDDDGPDQGLSVSYLVESAIAAATEAKADMDDREIDKLVRSVV